MAALLLGPGAPKLEPADLAGIAAGSNPGVLSLEQAYSLTLIHARNPAGIVAIGRANAFDPAALDQEAKSAGALDFDRFRRDFFSNGFRDPAPAFFAALKRRQGVDSAREQVALTQNMRRLFGQLIRGEASGVSQLQLEQVEHFLLRSRQELEIEMSSYRSAVDELKVFLGLSPSTPLVVDERILVPFSKAFGNIYAWQSNPARDLRTLGGLHKRLPPLEELTIGGSSLTQAALGTIPEGEFLHACIEAAATQRSILKDEHAPRDERSDLELRIRNLARGLILTHRNYEIERKGLELAVRESDQWSEQVTRPPAGGTAALAQAVNAVTQLTGVLQTQSRLYRGRTELVSQWLRFKEQSLKLYRELGTMPYDNWEAFYRSFLPESGNDREAP
jgi:hypothetical protein